MGLYRGPKIVRDSLVLALDAGSVRSYPGSGTTWYDLSGNNYDFTLNGSPTYEIHNGAKCFKFPGAYADVVNASRAGSISHDIGTACTIQIVYTSISGAAFNSCSRLFSVNDGSSTNNDFSTYFTLASCDTSKHGLWYKSSPGGMYPTSATQNATDTWNVITFKWTASNTAYVFFNGVQQNSAAMTSAFSYSNVGRMTVAMNSAFGGGNNLEHANVRVASVVMYDRELTAAEVAQNYNTLKGRFGL